MSRLSRSQQPTGTHVAPVFHSAFSRQLARARATTPTPSSPTSYSTLTDNREDEHCSQVLPEGDFVIVGQRFEVNFEHVYLNSKRLTPAHLGYKVKHRSALKGRREGSPIWRYGVELEYHVTLHLQRVHRIDPKTGLLSEASPALFSSPFEAAKVAGTGTIISYTP